MLCNFYSLPMCVEYLGEKLQSSNESKVHLVKFCESPQQTTHSPSPLPLRYRFIVQLY